MRFVERNALTLIQLAVLGVVAIILGMTVVRPLLSRAPARTTDPAGLPPGAITLSTDEMGNPVITPEQLTTALAAPVADDALEEGFDDQLRTIAADQPDQTAEMLKVWLEEPAQPEPEPAQ